MTIELCERHNRPIKYSDYVYIEEHSHYQLVWLCEHCQAEGDEFYLRIQLEEKREHEKRKSQIDAEELHQEVINDE